MNKIYFGDCFTIMNEIPDKSVDLILTDPPYSIRRIPAVLGADQRERLCEMGQRDRGISDRGYEKEVCGNMNNNEPADASGWISVKDRLPENEQDVIICAERRHYSNPNRFIQIVAKAFYTDGKHNTEHTAYAWSNDYIDMEYDEENDAYLIPEGWWESVEYGEEFSAVWDFVTHWMPLPEPPEEGTR